MLACLRHLESQEDIILYISHPVEASVIYNLTAVSTSYLAVWLLQICPLEGPFTYLAALLLATQSTAHCMFVLCRSHCTCKKVFPKPRGPAADQAGSPVFQVGLVVVLEGALRKEVRETGGWRNRESKGRGKERRKQRKENQERCQALVWVSVLVFSAMKGKRRREGLAMDFLPCLFTTLLWILEK